MATTEATPKTDLKCSRCEADIDTTGSPRWCKKCRAKYQREYQALRVEMVNGRAHAAGAAAAREALAAHFLRFPNSMFSGTEIWAMIQKAPIGGPDTI